MQRIGLALSGGGFRATLFHLGMIRFLRDAHILPSVTQITSVSGGSILAAHLVQNWDRYTGSPEDFDTAAAEVLRFVQMDIRNRIVRRFPLAIPLRLLSRAALQRPNRQLSRTGLLEYHYEKFLYGDTCLYQLPDRPRLSILATNLSEGCLCAFTRDGVVMQRRRPGQRFHFERIDVGLTTIPMAVTASSAFPGFFPPIELSGQDVGVDPGQFGRLAFTDGGVYDNLGVRMFRWMERSWMAREVPIELSDLARPDDMLAALRAAARSDSDSPLRRLSQMVDLIGARRTAPGQGSEASINDVLAGLWDVISHENLAREPAFARLVPADRDAELLLDAARRGVGEIESGELLWLNRQLVDAAFLDATGSVCFRSSSPCFDGVLVSDAGKQFKIKNARAAGLIATSMRATDIVMDRVWQLENDTFAGTPGFVFAPISGIVDAEQDPTAMRPELQRAAADIRTDLDRFTPLEISTLIRHGYCVGRAACRRQPDLFGQDLPTSAPWDPLADDIHQVFPPAPASERSPVPASLPETRQSRALQRSASRRIWSSLLDYRDWLSFVYVPILVPLLILLPYTLLQWHRQSQVAQRLVEGIAHSNQDYGLINQLLEEGPLPPFTGLPIEEVPQTTPIANQHVEVVADMRVLDLRLLKPGSRAAADSESRAFLYRRLRIQKTQAAGTQFRVHFRLPTDQLEIRSLNQRVPVTVHRSTAARQAGGPLVHDVEMIFDLTRVPVSEALDLPMELMSSDPGISTFDSLKFFADDETGLLSWWLLLPDGQRYENFELLREEVGQTGLAPERVIPAYHFDTLNGRVLAFAMLKVRPGYLYEARWDHRD